MVGEKKLRNLATAVLETATSTPHLTGETNLERHFICIDKQLLSKLQWQG